MVDHRAVRVLSGGVSKEAHDAWHRFATEEGTTVAALMEAVGLHLRDQRSPIAKAVLREARQIAGERRKR